MAVTSRLRRPTRVFVIPGSWQGLLRKGNIDLTARPVVRNPNGSISTVESISFWHDEIVIGKHRGVEVLMPKVIGNRVVGDKQADAHFNSTGRHLGMFANWHQADRYAVALHNWQAKYYAKYIR